MRLFLLFLVCSFGLNAQSYSYNVVSYANGNQGPMKGAPGDLFMSTITFSNSSNAPIQVFIDRFQKTIPAYWAVCYCYIQCHSPSDDTVTVDILPFSTTDVTLQFKTDSVNPGLALADFKMYQKGFSANTQTVNMVASTLTNVGFNELQNGSDLSIYPNPGTSDLTISTKANINSVRIFSLNGSLVLEQINEEKEMVMNSSTLLPGIYFIEVKAGNSIFMHKYIKQ